MLDTASPREVNARRIALPAWWGWAVLAVITVVVFATWLPHFNAPLGDSAEGRVLARFGLHVQNFWSLGPVESGFGTAMRPYVFSTNYAHHPPFANFFELATSAVAGQGEWQLRLYGYVAGLATPWLLAALLRQLRIAWGPTLLAVGLMVATNFYWVYDRVGGGFAAVLGLAAIVVYLRREAEPPAWAIGLGAAAGLITVMTSWPSALTAALLGLWLLTGRGIDRVTVVMGASMVLGAAITAAWILNATDLSELRSQTELRTAGTFTWAEFVQRQWLRATQLTPSWYRALMFPALAAGIADRRTRWPTLLLLIPPALWTFGGREGAFNHEFWNLPWMASIGVGMGALLDVLRRWLPSRVSRVAAAGLALLLVVAFASIVRGDTYDIYLGLPTDVGALAQAVQPPPDQGTAYVIENVPAPRWAAYYWGLQPKAVTADNVDEIPDDQVVVIRTDLLPDWVPEDAPEFVIAARGRYALVPGRALK